MNIKTFQEANEYLDSLIKPVVFAKITPEDAARKDPLDRMRELLLLLNNPQQTFKSILVGGTSGKGSTAYLISHILATAGYKTGFTLSPHLERINERIQMNNRAINNEEFVDLLNRVIPTIETMKTTPTGEPSHFEALIAMAFLYFAQENVDIAVVEVGLGGRYDATNTVYPLISVITNISLDHTRILGNTIEAIAKEKAGIIKRIMNSIRQAHGRHELRIKNKPLIVVTGVKQKSVIQIVEQKCRDVGATLYRLGKDFHCDIHAESEKGTIFTFWEQGYRSPDFLLSLKGAYQAENAALALETIFQLVQFGFTVSDNSIAHSFETAFFPGRFELLLFARSPVLAGPAARSSQTSLQTRSAQTVKTPFGSPSLASPASAVSTTPYLGGVSLILDGAHNPAKMKALTSSIGTIFKNRKKVFILGFKKEKDIKNMLSCILPHADWIILTQFSAPTYVSNQRALTPQEIAHILYSIFPTLSIPVIQEENPKKAIRAGQKLLKNKEGIVIVTGSLYLIGEIRGFVIREIKER